MLDRGRPGEFEHENAEKSELVMSKQNKKSKFNTFNSTPIKSAAIPPVISAKPEVAKTLPAAPQPAKLESSKPAVATTAAAKAVNPSQNHISLELFKPEAKKVCVAGSFNNWRPESLPLKPAGNGRWVGDLSVKPGRHEYLFVVDGQWLPDPNAKEVVQNPFGGTNSVLVVAE